MIVCGAVSLNHHQMFSAHDKFHKEDTKAFIKRLLQREEKIGLVLDKASWHTASIVTEFFDDNRDQIRTRYFPTGWPELNAIEGCWGILKGQPFAYRTYDTADERINATSEFLRTHRFHADIKKHVSKSHCKDFLS